MKLRLGLALVAALGLSACTDRDVALNHSYVTGFGTYQDGYGDNASAAEKAMNVDMKTASDLTISLRQAEFSPMMVHLKKGQAYNLKVINKDDHSISFSAADFFENAAVSKLGASTADNSEQDMMENPALISFVVPANSERSVQFVPVREGKYEFADAAPGIMLPSIALSPFSRGNTQGSFGLFIVE